jgi:hypothetical protein
VDGVHRGEHLLPVHADKRLGQCAVALGAALTLQHVGQVDLAALHHHVDGLLFHLDLRVEQLDDDLVQLALAQQLHQLDLVDHRLQQARVRVELDLLQRQDLAVGRQHPEDLRRAAPPDGVEL